MAKLPNYLLKNGYGIYVFRRSIPKNLRHIYKKES